MARYDVERLAGRLRELVQEGAEVAALERASPGSTTVYLRGPDKAKAQAWLTKVLNAVETTFGAQSRQFRHLQELMPERGPIAVSESYYIWPITGLLEGALDDLEKGFLQDQEHLIAGDLLDTILEQAAELNSAGYKDPAAVLARVSIEDSLKRLARSSGLRADQKAARINDALRETDVYAKPQWRMIQAWLDIGNSAAHGSFDDYTEDDVSNMISGISQFIISFFGGA